MDFYDPYIPKYLRNGRWYEGLSHIDIELTQTYDLVVITTAHSNVDYKMLSEAGIPVFDCKNVTKNLIIRENIEVL